MQEKLQRDLNEGLQATNQQIERDQEQLATRNTAFKASLRAFELDASGWSDKCLEAAASDLEQQMNVAKADRYDVYHNVVLACMHWGTSGTC